MVPAARAQIGSDRYAALVVDARSGGALFAANADQPRYPASLTKVMTVFMALEAVRDGRTTLATPIRVSSQAASMPPSRLGLVAGMTLTVEEAILALVTKSANDAAAALGEHLGGGSEERFAQLMTMRARAIGMTRTTFRNASGLPDLDQVSTARDMVTLGRRVQQDFPRQYGYFSTANFVFRGRTHWNHNRLLQDYDGTDGIKTGYVNDSGFNLLASAERDGVRLIAAVFGGRSGRERDQHMMALLDQGFGQMGLGAQPRRPALVASASAARLPKVARTRLVAGARASGPLAAAARTGLAASPRASRPPPLVARTGGGALRPALASPAARPGITKVVAATRKGMPVAAAPQRPGAAAAKPGLRRVEQGDAARASPRTVARAGAVQAGIRHGKVQTKPATAAVARHR